MPNELEAIIQYKMTQDQAKAYKLCLIWQDLCTQEFPGFRHARLRTKGDPRKSLVFRHMLKLVIETKGLIKDADYRIYILAQLTMLKSFAQGGAILISPTILTGNHAWKRWKYWKYRFDKRQLTKTNEDQVPEHLIIGELKKTYEFLSSRYSQLTKHRIGEAVSDGLMKKWVFSKDVSAYYIVLSPLMINQNFGIDLGVYKKSITPNIQKAFIEIFRYEFQATL